ncbi:hypothetical protein F4779DRAFT_602809 [Xylariaceae sp. FL0662B]|nr:hypothetical protein F4779DRAFT_602809 [Xylariaceae sp. FL0662B]
MANFGPLTTTFTPSGTGCQSIHIGTSLNQGFYWLQQGTVSDCFPSNFHPENDYYYSPGICPQSLTYACSVGVGLGSSIITAATCCPSGFNCRDRSETDPNACISVMTSDSSFIVDVLFYETGSPTKIGGTSAFTRAGAMIYAKGLVVWRADTDAEWPASITASATLTSSASAAVTITSTTADRMPAATAGMPITTSADSSRNNTTSSISSSSTPTQMASPGLSTKTKIGLAIGVSLGALFFFGAVVAAYLLGKRNRRSSQDKTILSDNINREKKNISPPSHELEEQRRIVELTAQREPAELMSSYH